MVSKNWNGLVNKHQKKGRIHGVFGFVLRRVQRSTAFASVNLFAHMFSHVSIFSKCSCWKYSLIFGISVMTLYCIHQVEVKFIFQTCWIPGAKKSNPLHCRKTFQSGSQRQPQPPRPPLPQLQQLPRLPQVPLQHSTSTPQTALWRPTGICRGRCL